MLSHQKIAQKTKASQALVARVQRELTDRYVTDPAILASDLLAAARRLAKQRAMWVRAKKRHLARKAHKKIPRAK